MFEKLVLKLSWFQYLVGSYVISKSSIGGGCGSNDSGRSGGSSADCGSGSDSRSSSSSSSLSWLIKDCLS